MQLWICICYSVGEVPNFTMTPFEGITGDHAANNQDWRAPNAVDCLANINFSSYSSHNGAVDNDRSRTKDWKVFPKPLLTPSISPALVNDPSSNRIVKTENEFIHDLLG